MDFVHDALADGRPFRVLTVVDQWSHESPLLEVATAMSGRAVADALDRVLVEAAIPRSITVDHGTEFTSRALEDWAYHRGVALDFIHPGKPVQNAHIERQRELHASQEQSPTRFLLELLNGLPQVSAHELRVPIDPVQGARHDVLLCHVDRPGEGFHPIGPRSHPCWRPKRCFHHFISHPAKKEGIGPLEVLDRVTMQVFVRDNCTVIAAPVQCDVDGIPKGSHYVRVPIAIGPPDV
jgi:hypothetical protein